MPPSPCHQASGVTATKPVMPPSPCHQASSIGAARLVILPPTIRRCPHPAATSQVPVGSPCPFPGGGDTVGAGMLQSFREELESLIQEQMKKGNNSSHVWALRQIADFMATTSPAVLPTSPMGTATPAKGFLGGKGNGLVKFLRVFS